MHKPVSLFIGVRYMHRRVIDRFERFISWFASIAITLGVMAIVTILSVMNGFERKLENNILSLIPQAMIISDKGSLNPQQYPASTLMKLKGIKGHIKPCTTGDVILQSTHSVAIGIMLGIQPNEIDPLTAYLVNTKQQVLQPGEYNVILGKQLANKLNVQHGDKLRLIIPSSRQFTPIGWMLSQRLFNVIGTFFTNSEVDSYQVLVNLQDASRLMHYPISNITGWRLWLDKPLEIVKVSQQKLPHGLIWKDWRERKGNIFQAVRMEKNIMGIMLSLIIVVAIFNIITSLSLLIAEKQSEVAILQAQGLKRYQIVLIFMIQSAGASTIGTVFGILLASQINKLMPAISIFFGIADPIPVDMSVQQIMIIALIVITISTLSTLYPSWYATTMQPAKALRYYG